MEKGMASSLPIEKLDRSNYASVQDAPIFART